MTLEQHLIYVCQTLNSKGKKPSMALLRANKSMPATMPEMITALKSWEMSPEISATIEVEQTATQTSNLTSDELIEHLLKRIEKLENRVNRLDTLLDERAPL